MRISDWSSDVCSSDLRGLGLGYVEGQLRQRFGATQPRAVATIIQASRNPVTADDLRLGLTSIGNDLVSGGDARGWFDRLRAELSSLVVIHKEGTLRSEAHTSELQSLMRISYAVFCLKKTA